MKLFTMFSGIGAPELAFNEVFPDGEIVGSSEIDKYAEAIYKYHFPKVKNYGDATTINVRQLPDFDILIAGFPCQAFSIAGKREGFNDLTRGTLFFEIVRLLQAKRPRYFILENVKGILSHDSGRTFNIILKSLSECGYELQWQVLNTRWYLPQNRERVYIVGHIRGKRRPEILPIGKADGVYKETNENYAILRWQNKTDGIVKDNTVPTLGASTGSDIRKKPVIIQKGRGKNKGGKKKVCPTISSNAFEQNNYICAAQRGRKTGQQLEVSQGDYTNTLTNVAKDNYIINPETTIRRLTPVECERLQGFPDNYTKYGTIDGKKVLISDTQRYKCLGNAISVPVIQEVLERLKVYS